MSQTSTATQSRAGKRFNDIRGLTRLEIDTLTADRMDSITRKALRALKQRDFSSAQLSQLGVLIGILTDKSRLIRGA